MRKINNNRLINDFRKKNRWFDNTFLISIKILRETETEKVRERERGIERFDQQQGVNYSRCYARCNRAIYYHCCSFIFVAVTAVIIIAVTWQPTKANISLYVLKVLGGMKTAHFIKCQLINIIDNNLYGLQIYTRLREIKLRTRRAASLQNNGNDVTCFRLTLTLTLTHIRIAK